MIKQDLFTSVRSSLAPAQATCIFLTKSPNYDQVAAGLALFLSLKNSGKQTIIVCPIAMTVEFSSLVGVDKVQTELSRRNLIVSFGYVEDSIEKVSYNIENNKFNLVIQPKPGFPPLSSETVNYSYSGGEADLIFTVGAKRWQDLGELYQESDPLFEKQPVVNIDISPVNNQFGKINLIDPIASSCSEIVVNLISRLGLPVDRDIATNLFLGIKEMTNSFSSLKTGAGAFEAAAFCLRAGANRTALRPELERERRKKKISLKPMPTEVSAIKKPEKPVFEEEIVSSKFPAGPSVKKTDKTDEVSKKKPSPDWFEPKIYKGNTRI